MKPSTKMYGLLHEADGTPRVIEPRTVKVGIGLAKGPALHVYLDNAGKWCVVVGREANRFEARRDAVKFYREAKAKAPERKYPQRINYFTFNRISPDGIFEPEWDAIEAHGSIPTEIDIVFVRDDPFSASYQMWTAAEKKCEGDGINALRINSLAQTAEEKSLAATAERDGAKYFPVVNGCWTKACPYAQNQNGKASPCRPHGRLLFQLLSSPRLGGTAYFDTTGFRSISQLFSCIQTFKAVTGQGDPERGFVAGIPLKLVLRPYRVTHDGKAATQYGVSLEFRAESALDLKRQLIEHGAEFRLSGQEPLRRLMSAPEDLPATDDDPEAPEQMAVAMAAEFHGDHLPDDDDFAAPDVRQPVSMPRRKSEVPSEPDPAEEFQRAWDDPPEPEQPPPVQEPPIGEPAPSGGKAISEPQRKRLYAIAKASGVSDADFKAHLEAMGYKSSSDVLRSDYDDICGHFEALKQ